MIHDVILNALEVLLQDALIDSIDEEDVARAGVVKQGPLQGDPEPDQARISVTLHENDPEAMYGSGDTSSMEGAWIDEVVEVECGGTIIMARRFSIKARCLLETTQETTAEARQVASTVRDRIEGALPGFGRNLSDPATGEFVSRSVATVLASEMLQAGGPDAYDYHIKVRFELQTTRSVTL